MASVVLTSCVNEDKEVMESASKKAISFDMPVMKPTRAAGEIDGTVYPTTETFKVFCKSYTGAYTDWTTHADYFAAAGEDVAYNNGSSKWSTNPVHYWPELGNKLAFAAYSPATASGTFAQTQTGLTITGFSTEDNVANQYDLMYTPRVIDLDKNSAGTDVPLVFKHALTSVVFKATKTDADATYTIKSLTVNGLVSTTGNFNQNIPTPAELDGTATWTNLATATDMTYSILADKTIDVAQAGTALTGVGSTAGATTALLLIPQGVDANTTVTITYTKKTGSNSLDATATIKLNDFVDGTSAPKTTWEMGNRYIYNIIFGANKPIYFAPTVADWNDVALSYTIE
jgi:hypothetical protein